MDTLSLALLAVSLTAAPIGQDAPPTPPPEAAPDASEPQAEPSPADKARQEREQLEAMLNDPDEQRTLRRWFVANPDKALPFIDSYLEGALAMIEKDEPAEAALASFEKGVAFAAVAESAFREPMFSAYASAFAGWSRDEQKQFRNGQRLVGEGRQAMKAGDAQRAVALFAESYNHARPLRDAWGLAMAHAGRGAAYAELGDHAAAIRDLQQAVTLYTKLRLRTNAAKASVDLSRSFRATDRNNAATAAALAAYRSLNQDDPPELHTLVLTELAEAYDAMGRPDSAARIRRRIPEPAPTPNDAPPAAETDPAPDHAPDAPAPPDDDDR